jgi:DNA-binding CsgD family transcriptional regulator
MINDGMAFIVYQPGPPGTAARVNISATAETVLAFAKDPSGKTLPSRDSAVTLCARWVSLLDKAARTAPEAGPEGSGAHAPIDIFLSHRRKYEVRGLVLEGRLQGSVSRYPSFVFVLERADAEQGALQKLGREKRLSPREQDLVRHLFSDLSNKEIGQAMGLSANTVKGYLKSLALKLGASSRVGILAALYSPGRAKKGPSTPPPRNG